MRTEGIGSANIQLQGSILNCMKILITEDEVKLAQALKRGLEQEGWAVDVAFDAEESRACIQAGEYDAIVLDRMLPGDEDGLDICKVTRNGEGPNRQTPILMLTARGEVVDRVQGLNSGADDYLIKPFAFDELLARLNALVRRPAGVLQERLRLGKVTIEPAKKLVELNDKPIKLSRKEYGLLEYLAFNGGQTLSKNQIIEHVWDFDADVLDNTVEVFVRNLRKKLGEDIIQTVRGFGYRIGEVVE